MGPQYSQAAIRDAAFYRLVKLTGWTPRQLDSEVTAEEAARLLRADNAWNAARAEADARAQARNKG